MENERIVCLLGGNGMLGRAVKLVLQENLPEGFKLISPEAFNCLIHAFEHGIPEDSEYVINCIGMTKPRCTPGREQEAIFVNSMFPLALSESCRRAERKLIHISTDCVFSGRDGGYSEDSPVDPQEIYGASKFLGEPKDCMVIRTSIIGPQDNTSSTGPMLFEWAKRNAGGDVKGFTDHLWSGVTTLEAGKQILRVITEGLWQVGLFHLVSPEPITKYNLLHKFNNVFQWDLKIEKTESGKKCDRSMTTKYNIFNTKSLDDQLEELKQETRL